MVFWILGGIAVVVVGFLLFTAMRPSQFHIERSLAIAALPETVFDRVNDFHEWGAWSPWEKLDPDLKRTYEGPSSGVGAKYAWSGNKQVGQGRMTIEKSNKPSLIAIKLEFIKPFTATNAATFSFAPAPEGTRVTWAMDGNHVFIMKMFSVFMSMDKMVGGDFERGLAAMKTKAEAVEAAKAAR